MFLTLLAVVVALVLGHMAQPLAAAVRHYGWFSDCLRWLDARFPQDQDHVWRGPWGIAIALLPPLLAVGLFQLALHAPFLGVAGLLFGIVVLFYCWGPRDLDLDVDAIVESRDQPTRLQAAASLWPHGQAPSLDPASLVSATFRNAKRRWFGVLFWFLLLGPFGALLYRLAALAAEGEAGTHLSAAALNGARRLLAWLDWPVAQLMTLSMALVGNFDAVLGAWKDNGGAAFDADADFLAAAGRASVRSDIADDAQDDVESGVSDATTLVAHLGELPELRDAMALVWRILLVWLAVIALFVVAGWIA